MWIREASCNGRTESIFFKWYIDFFDWSDWTILFRNRSDSVKDFPGIGLSGYTLRNTTIRNTNRLYRSSELSQCSPYHLFSITHIARQTLTPRTLRFSSLVNCTSVNSTLWQKKLIHILYDKSIDLDRFYWSSTNSRWT